MQVTDAESRSHGVQFLAALRLSGRNGQFVAVLLAVPVGPPQLRMRKLDRKDGLPTAGRQRDVLRRDDRLIRRGQTAHAIIERYRLRFFGGNIEPSFQRRFVVRRGQLGQHDRVGQINVFGSQQPDVLPNAHGDDLHAPIPTGRSRGFPIGVRRAHDTHDRPFGLPGGNRLAHGLRTGMNQHGEHVFLVAAQQFRDVVLERRELSLMPTEMLAVEPHVGQIVDSIESQVNGFALPWRRREGLAIPPLLAGDPADLLGVQAIINGRNLGRTFQVPVHVARHGGGNRFGRGITVRKSPMFDALARCEGDDPPIIAAEHEFARCHAGGGLLLHLRSLANTDAAYRHDGEQGRPPAATMGCSSNRPVVNPVCFAHD